MRRVMFLLSFTVLLLAGCSKNDSICDDRGDDNGLVTPELRATVNTLDNHQSPMSGVLEVFPCQPNSAIYFGNYVNGSLSPFNGRYYLQDGNIYGDNNLEISLPIGTYNIIYWGTPKYEEPVYSNPAIVEPPLTIGADLSTLSFGLRRNIPDTTYYPVFDLVYAVKPVHIGAESLSADMKRQVAGLKVIVKDKNNGVLSSSIANVKVHIGGIAEKINVYTAAPENQTKTVAFPLVLSADGTQMSNATVMLFPSAVKPLFQLIITLKNGTVKTFKQTLSAPLKANTKLTLTLTLGDIFSEENPGDFTIDNWVEESQIIDVPSLD